MGKIITKAANPMSEYLVQLELIVSNTEFKNREEAAKYETLETRMAGDAYVNAVLKKDTFESYQWEYQSLRMYLADIGCTYEQIIKYMRNVSVMPYNIKEELTNRARAIRIATYKEPNKYYLNLMGKPSLENKDPLIPIPHDFYMTYREEGTIYPDQNVHELSKRYQELLINSPYYQELLNEYPNCDYLKHIGSYAIPVEVSRPALDGEILLINESKLSTYHETLGRISVSADVLHTFVTIYKKTRRYIYETLRGDFSQIYANYNHFIRFLTIYVTMGQCLNEFMHKSTKLIYMNNAIANDYFELYGLPSVLMEGTSLTKFLKKFRLLLMDKGTNVVYRVKDLIGYEYTDVYTLIMVKQQAFRNGYPVYYVDANGVKRPQQEIVFRRYGTTQNWNTSYFEFKRDDKIYSLEEITSGDPRWWDTPDVRRRIQEMNYTLSNSKYIQLSTTMSMEDIWWQCCVLLRGLLDNKNEIQYQDIGISQSIRGKSTISIFDAVLILIIMMNWNSVDFRGMNFMGNLYLPNSFYDGDDHCVDMLFNGLNADGTLKPPIPGLPYKISSFNFEFKNTQPELYRKIYEFEYLNPSELMPRLERIFDREDIDIGEAIMTNIKLLHGYLSEKLRTASTIHEFRQVTDVYRWLFLVDPVRHWDTPNDEQTIDMIMKSFGISSNELKWFLRFFEDDTTDASHVTVPYKDSSIRVSIYDILNNDVKSLLTDYPFDDPEFLEEFDRQMQMWSSHTANQSTTLSTIIKSNYQDIIRDKVMIDLSKSANGPTTFESLLYKENPTLYRSLQLMRVDKDQLLILMRSIIRALEIYTNSPLPALEFKALGQINYINILKEVITYFKSYMVEFTKEEFRYIMGGLFDLGGSPNMLAMFDEVNSIHWRVIPRDVLHLYDVSCATVRLHAEEILSSQIYDEVIFNIKGKYGVLKEDPNYKTYFDHGTHIDTVPFDDVDDDEIVIARIIELTDIEKKAFGYWKEENNENKSQVTYKMIINRKNLNPSYDNYIGNAR